MSGSTITDGKSSHSALHCQSWKTQIHSQSDVCNRVKYAPVITVRKVHVRPLFGVVETKQILEKKMGGRNGLEMAADVMWDWIIATQWIHLFLTLFDQTVSVWSPVSTQRLRLCFSFLSVGSVSAAVCTVSDWNKPCLCHTITTPSSLQLFLYC